MITQRKTILICLALLSVSLVYACAPQEVPADSTATAEPAPTQFSTATPMTATETAMPSVPCDLSLPGPADLPILLCETFDDNSYGWQEESQDNEYARYTSEISDGLFAVDYTAKGFGGFQNTALTWFDVAQAQDFSLSVRGNMLSDFERVSWGVAFRSDAERESFFLFSIFNDGTYGFEIYENGGWISLVSRRPFEEINLGEANQLTMTAEGSDFEFAINGQAVQGFSGGLLDGRDILLVVSVAEGASAAFTFDELVLQAK